MIEYMFHRQIELLSICVRQPCVSNPRHCVAMPVPLPYVGCSIDYTACNMQRFSKHPHASPLGVMMILDDTRNCSRKDAITEHTC
jgi:hypothetical protein